MLIAEARTTGSTGVEMEALTAASVAALTVYDMIKGVERGAEIGSVVLMEKSGGRSACGGARRENRDPDDLHLRRCRCLGGSVRPRARRTATAAGADVVEQHVLSRHREAIEEALRRYSAPQTGISLIFTTGGTGLSPTT